jgi:hypothetical protein
VFRNYQGINVMVLTLNLTGLKYHLAMLSTFSNITLGKGMMVRSNLMKAVYALDSVEK